MARRRAAGQTVPHLILSAADANEGDLRAVLRAAGPNGIGAHEAVLTALFSRRLNEVAQQFPADLVGTQRQQRAQMRQIEARLLTALDEHAAQHPQAPAAKGVAKNMFATAYGERGAFTNDFDRSNGHVLAYTFLSLEKQWGLTREHALEHLPEAQTNGMNMLIERMTGLIDGHCDTREVEELLQLVGCR
jgi:hypothetical protein